MRYTCKVNSKVVLLQKLIRGFLARRKFQKLIEQKLRQSKTKREKNSILGNSRVVKEIQKKAEKLGLNLEMLFRAANSSNKEELSLEEFRVFLKTVKLGLKDSQISRFLYVLDEDFKGSISRREYIETLISFGLNQEANTFEVAKRLSKETISNFYRLIRERTLNIH